MLKVMPAMANVREGNCFLRECAPEKMPMSASKGPKARLAPITKRMEARGEDSEIGNITKRDPKIRYSPSTKEMMANFFMVRSCDGIGLFLP